LLLNSMIERASAGWDLRRAVEKLRSFRRALVTHTELYEAHQS
jgi:hypothetical protein